MAGDLPCSCAMSAPKVILVPTDFSDPANRAVDYAIELAEKLGAGVTVMHAYEIRPMNFLDRALVNTTDVTERFRRAAQDALDSAVARLNTRGVALMSLVRRGEAHDLIEATAEEISADLIVIGTHGRRGLSRFLLGSVAELIVRTATRPVLTVHAGK